MLTDRAPQDVFDVTRLEFDLFDYLYQRQGKVVDRSSLLRDVWGSRTSGAT